MARRHSLLAARTERQHRRALRYAKIHVELASAAPASRCSSKDDFIRTAILLQLHVRLDPFRNRYPLFWDGLQLTCNTASPNPSTVNTAWSPDAIEKVGMRLPVITTMPAVSERPRSASRSASQARVANGSSAFPSPINLPLSVWRPA